MAHSPGLSIAIVGSGIAGLTAAIALRRAGHAVVVYERSRLLNEVGAAIMVPPNASRALLAWGIDARQGRFVNAKSLLLAKGANLETVFENRFEGYEDKFRAPWWWCHRGDLHEQLRRLAYGEELDQAGKEGLGRARVVLGAEVVKYHPFAPAITLSNGTFCRADVVIAADGVHSLAVETVLGKPNPHQTQNLYNFCYRFLIPANDLWTDPRTRHWLEKDEGRAKFYLGSHKRLVWYPCRDHEVHNFVGIFHNDEQSAMKQEDWQTSVDKSKLLDKFADFHPSILAVLEKATNIKQWPLLYRPPIPTWTKGQMVLAGDAAHPMLPHQGQGGAQAVEDGVVLGIILSGCTADETLIGQRLAAYEAIRMKRASVMQVFSNAGQNESRLVRKEASKYMPEEEVPKNEVEFSCFNMAYDVVEDCLRYMREQVDASFQLPKRFFKIKPRRGIYP